MKLRSLLSLEGIGLESNRSSALTEYGCEQVIKSVSFFFGLEDCKFRNHLMD